MERGKGEDEAEIGKRKEREGGMGEGRSWGATGNKEGIGEKGKREMRLK